MSETYEGYLEVDHERGVVYFHSKELGCTLLRVCRLPKPVPLGRQIDITHMHGVSYGELEVMTFERWKAEVDAEVRKLCGLGADNIDDVDYRGLFDTGSTPEEAAVFAVKNAGMDTDNPLASW